MNSNNQPKTVGERIKFLRKKNKETQEELGEALDLTQKSISNIENNITVLNVENLTKIANHYNVSTDYICIGTNSSSILELLEKYISIKFTNLNIGDSHYKYPTLQINSLFFDYLIQIAHAKQVEFIYDEIREDWIEKITKTFYENNKSKKLNLNNKFIPVPEHLILPDENKRDWKLGDLLREINNLIYNSKTEI